MNETKNTKFEDLSGLLDKVNARSKEVLGEKKTFTIEDDEVEISYEELVDKAVEQYALGRSVAYCADSIRMGRNKFRRELTSRGLVLGQKDMKRKDSHWLEILRAA